MILNKKNKAYTVKTLLIIALLLLVSSAQGLNLLDRMNKVAEQAWYDQYIPESSNETIPLDEYDNFEVTELFRSVTIEDLEASITGGYPMPWLEETLKDESIPWEDRYWLDCRVRAAIAQNTHTFFNPAGSPVHVDADKIFPGEYYWQEHMIVDPEGHNIPMVEEHDNMISNNEGRPVLPRINCVDIGLIYNLFGRKIGDLALAFNGMSLSRDASIGVYVTGQTGEWPSNDYQYYACLLYPDGSFREIPFDGTGRYSGTMSADGNTLAFFKRGTSSDGESFIEIMDRDGNFLNRIPVDFNFEMVCKPDISSDGRYASCRYRQESGGAVSFGHSAVVDILNGEIELSTKHTGTDLTSIYCSFSPDGNYFCIGGFSKGRVINLTDGTEYIYPETAYREETNDNTRVSCSNSRMVTVLSTLRSSMDSESFQEFRVYVSDSEISSERLDRGSYRGLLSPVVSPNGHFIFLSNAPSWNGVPCGDPFSIIFQVSERIL